MGTYLSTPVTDKCQESGEALECPAAPLVWGVVDMQGWRKSMEDSHVAQTDVQVPPHLQTDQDHDAKVFGVFDGHGGAEVARFTQLYLVDVLTKQPTWVKEPEEQVASPVGQALVDTFHALDRMIDQPERRNELIRLRAEKPQPGERKTISDDLPIPPEKIHHSPVDVVKIGETVDENRSDDAEETEQAKSIEMNEISNNEKRESADGAAESGEVKKEAVEEVPVEKETTDSDVTESLVEDKKEDVDEAETKPVISDGEEASAPENEEQGTDAVSAASKDVDKSGESAADASGKEEPSTDEPDATPVAEANDSADAGEKDTKDTPNESIETAKPLEPETPQDAATGETTKETKLETAEAPALKEESETMNGSGDVKMDNGSKATSEEGDGAAKEDDDSNAVVGKEDAAKLDQDLMLEDSDSDKEEDPAEAKNRKVSVMFQKLLNLGGNSGQMSLKVADSPDIDDTASASTEASQPIIVPTVIQNGRQICNLPDHPIHAGCTAIVAVLIGRKLTVANAGDSRAVLCRAGGRMEALSFDHKPSQNRELTRINNAGGFVNQFGRVNGNLNLSRSIGDLKYKQVPGIHPAGQMITAEPDIVEVYLQSNDEFFILGCDGIWDCLTNLQAVKYVRERIDTMSPTEIGVQMLDEIISDDPRATQGIGGDNMTVMVIDLQPGKRSYRSNTSE